MPAEARSHNGDQIAGRPLIACCSEIVGIVGVVLTAELIREGSSERDPTGWLYGLALAGVGLAVAAFLTRRRLLIAVPALVGGALCVLGCWTLGVLFSG